MSVQLTEMPGLPWLYARAVGQALRAVRPPGLRGRGPSDDLSAATATLARVVHAPDRLARYRLVCGYPPDDTVLPPAFPHVSAFPLQLLLMTSPSFPFRAVGMVHVSNAIHQERPLSPAEPLDLSVSATDLRPHRRGRQVTLVTEARTAGELVWTEESVFLSKERPAAGVPSPAPSTPEPPNEGVAGVASPAWRLPPDLGRSYAAASGDRNPIHLFDLTARLFGFRRHIAHGMWTTSRALADLRDRLPERFDVAVAFKAPLALPGSAQLVSRAEPGRVDFEVAAVASREPADAAVEARSTYLTGTVTSR